MMTKNDLELLEFIQRRVLINVYFKIKATQFVIKNLYKVIFFLIGALYQYSGAIKQSSAIGPIILCSS